ncbi:permease prefix domain 1-containing protein, partial [Lacticaseibacillus nasuensis]
MATNEAFSAAINARLDAAFARYPAAPPLTELRQEIAGNLLAAVQDLAASGATPEAAVAQAWQEFG